MADILNSFSREFLNILNIYIAINNFASLKVIIMKVPIFIIQHCPSLFVAEQYGIDIELIFFVFGKLPPLYSFYRIILGYFQSFEYLS